jgi:hypothetical protein
MDGDLLALVTTERVGWLGKGVEALWGRSGQEIRNIGNLREWAH